MIEPLVDPIRAANQAELARRAAVNREFDADAEAMGFDDRHDREMGQNWRRDGEADRRISSWAQGEFGRRGRHYSTLGIDQDRLAEKLGTAVEFYRGLGLDDRDAFIRAAHLMRHGRDREGIAPEAESRPAGLDADAEWNPVPTTTSAASADLQHRRDRVMENAAVANRNESQGGRQAFIERMQEQIADDTDPRAQLAAHWELHQMFPQAGHDQMIEQIQANQNADRELARQQTVDDRRHQNSVALEGVRNAGAQAVAGVQGGFQLAGQGMTAASNAFQAMLERNLRAQLAKEEGEADQRRHVENTGIQKDANQIARDRLENESKPEPLPAETTRENIDAALAGPLTAGNLAAIQTTIGAEQPAAILTLTRGKATETAGRILSGAEAEPEEMDGLRMWVDMQRAASGTSDPSKQYEVVRRQLGIQPDSPQDDALQNLWYHWTETQPTRRGWGQWLSDAAGFSE